MFISGYAITENVFYRLIDFVNKKIALQTAKFEHIFKSLKSGLVHGFHYQGLFSLKENLSPQFGEIKFFGKWNQVRWQSEATANVTLKTGK